MLKYFPYAIKTHKDPAGVISLFLYGMRTGGFLARKESIIGAPNRFFPCIEARLNRTFLLLKNTYPYDIRELAEQHPENISPL